MCVAGLRSESCSRQDSFLEEETTSVCFKVFWKPRHLSYSELFSEKADIMNSKVCFGKCISKY